MKIQLNKQSITRTAGRLAIAATAAAVVCLGSQKLAGQSNGIAASLVEAARMPIPVRYAAYLTPLDRESLIGNPLATAINGKGFFHVKISDSIGKGDGYTRNGAITRDGNGYLTVGGNKLVPSINVPLSATKLEIQADGRVIYTMPGQPFDILAGQITLAHFDFPRGLQPLGNGIFTDTDTDASGPAIIDNPGKHGMGTLVQGFLETDGIRQSVVIMTPLPREQ